MKESNFRKSHSSLNLSHIITTLNIYHWKTKSMKRKFTSSFHITQNVPVQISIHLTCLKLYGLILPLDTEAPGKHVSLCSAEKPRGKRKTKNLLIWLISIDSFCDIFLAYWVICTLSHNFFLTQIAQDSSEKLTKASFVNIADALKSVALIFQRTLMQTRLKTFTLNKKNRDYT